MPLSHFGHSIALRLWKQEKIYCYAELPEGGPKSIADARSPTMPKEPAIKEVQLNDIINKFVFLAIILAVALGAAFAQTVPQGPPAFVTLPRHPSIDRVRPGTDHPMPLRLELRGEMFEMVGVFRVGGNGGGNGGSGNGNGGGSGNGSGNGNGGGSSHN